MISFSPYVKPQAQSVRPEVSPAVRLLPELSPAEVLHEERNCRPQTNRGHQELVAGYTPGSGLSALNVSPK